VTAGPDAVASVLVLHGGASRSGSPMVSPTQLSVLRMVPIARRIARLGRGRLAVFRLLNATRGWDTQHTPADDARWALAPWVYPADEPPASPAGRRILIVHGTRDRIASPARSAALAERLARETTVTYVTVDGGTHAMLRHHGTFDRPAAEFAAATLLDAPASGTMERVLAGEGRIEL
jgi:pimeloyl-ACP methyl ester carboxylesterase